MTKTSQQSVVARESQHTQLPWRSIEIGETGEISGQPSIPVFDLIGDVTRYRIATVAGPDAEFIVRACNAHTKLVEALQRTLKFAKEFRADHPKGSTEHTLSDLAVKQAEQALRLAQGEK